MKIPAAFAPKSWEMPPGFVVLEESASVVTREFDGEKLDWLVALVEIPTLEHPIVWIRPLDVRFDAGFVVLGIATKSPFIITRNCPSNAPDTLLTMMCLHHRVGRVLFFNADGDLRKHGEESSGAVVFSSDGMASWLVDGMADNNKTPVPFRWNKVLMMEQFFHLSANEIWNRLQELLHKPNRKISFARQFALADENTRQELVFEAVPLEQKKFDKLLRSLFHSQDFWDELKEYEVEVELYVPNGKMPEIEFYIEGDISQPPDGLNEKVVSLWRHIQPVRKAIIKYPSIANWLHEKSESSNASFIRPTMHEKLEAQLHWRDWLDSINQHESEKL